jgi:hypothetical protein
MSIPALVIAFNRPEKLRLALESLASTDVRNIQVSLDGPRADTTDVTRIAECVDVIESFRHRFEVLNIRQNKHNLGCRQALQKALGEFFGTYDRGIIVEDDILVSQKFVDFATWALTEYENDETIWVVNGWSPFNPGEIGPFPWLSRIPIVWGWATWRTRWSQYDPEIEESAFVKPSELKTNLSLPFSEEFDEYWTNGFSQIRKGFDTWDYQLVFSMWKNGGMAITPPSRLTQNIGFDHEATHTFQPSGRSNFEMEEHSLDQRFFAFKDYSDQLIIESERIQFAYHLNKPRVSMPSSNFQKMESLLFKFSDSLDRSGHSNTNFRQDFKRKLTSMRFTLHQFVRSFRFLSTRLKAGFRHRFLQSGTRKLAKRTINYIYWGVRSRYLIIRNLAKRTINYIYWGVRSRIR